MFIKGKELEKVFQTEAAFYTLNTNGREQLCRNLVSIRRKGSDSEAAEAIFVLQNPGQCRPVSATEPPTIDVGFPSSLPLVEAKPDYTLHQLMRLMERMGWNYVQVINLTDLCSGDYSDFKERHDFIQENGEARHSIFTVERRAEIEALVNSAGTVIAGWGTKDYTRNAAGEAMEILTAIRPVNGLPHATYPKFYHPYPRIPQKCIEWLDDMEKQLQPMAALE